MCSVVLLVLIGLPGSGKSTLARNMATSGVTRASERDERSDKPTTPTPGHRLNHSQCGKKRHLRFYHLEFDRIIPTESVVPQLKWKACRKEILRCLDEQLGSSDDKDQLSSSTIGDENSDPSNCSQHDLLDDDLKTEICTKFMACIYNTKLSQQDDTGSVSSLDTPCKVYIIDDNMYYSSMRYQYFQLARKYHIGYAQLYFPSSTADALHHNHMRQLQVPDSVIVSMATKLEPPSPSAHWEKYTLNILDPSKEAEFSAVELLLREAMADYVQGHLVDDEETKEEARVVCSRNLIHQSDQALRKLVSTTVALSKEKGLRGPELKLLAGTLNRRRNDLLSDMRQRRLLVDPSLDSIANGGKDENGQLFTFLKTLFELQS